MPQSTQTIPARTGRAIHLSKNDTIRIINTYGTQVVDFWAFTLAPTQPQPLTSSSSSSCSSSTPSPPPQTITAYLSPRHTLPTTLHLQPQLHDTLSTNLRQPILSFTADTSPGVHDALIPACDAERYRQLLSATADTDPDHASCAANLRAALAQLGIPWPAAHPLLEHWTPAPVNLFMNVPVAVRGGGSGGEGGGFGVGSGVGVGANLNLNLSFEAPVCQAGDYVEMRALVDCVVVMSCCPQDLVPVNGKDCQPRSVEFMVRGC